MKRNENIKDHQIFLSFDCPDCYFSIGFNPSEVITFGPPICDCGKKMVYEGVDYVTYKDSE